ncbi:glycosyltransferase [Dokdonella sp.]|uniref:glycosyltransferase n=1 Tax=Dokdonella sp. TaxID=2291710 RepID=UPI0031C23129|nr:glycosyltransferase [Dokdonella sp.]
MRLAQLSIYPLGEPRHGGQLRGAALRDFYRAQGIEVHGLAAMHEDAYRNERRGEDIALPAAWPGWRADLPRFADLQSGACLASEAGAWRRFKAWLDALQPDVIALEQPWLWPAVERWLDARPAQAARPRLVYSSQNIEWRLKRDEVDARQPAQRQAIAEVEALERSLARQADLLIACTDADLAALRDMAGEHAARARFITAPNAIAPFQASPQRAAAMRKRLGRTHWPLFVGSAHPPNASGFWDMLAPSLAFLRPDEQIIVAGGVSHLIRGDRRYQDWSGINEPRLALLGEVTREELSALLYGASVIVLPITTGGGSNLKTAEAIYTGRPVLATPHALRGYGHAGQWPTVHVADTAADFRRVLRDLMDRPPAAEPPAYAAIRARVTWDRTLAALDGTIAALTAAEGAATGPR